MGHRSGPLVSLAAGLIAVAGCMHGPPLRSTPSAPIPASAGQPVTTLPVPAEPSAAATGIPQELAGRIAALTMTDVIDIALRNNAATRSTWASARAAAASLGSARSSFYPAIDLDANASRVKQAAVGGRFSFLQTSYGPALSLRYMLLDFGGRAGEVERARHALLAAGLSHNATIQGVVLDVEKAYYGFLGAKAQLTAAAAALNEARTNTEAAERRHDAGVATIADVLQARTAEAQAELDWLTADGEIRVLLGGLASAMGLPANTALDVGELPAEAPIESISSDIDELIDTALAARPDLAAARAHFQEKRSAVDIARSSGLPDLNLTGNANRVYYEPSVDATYSDNWSIALAFRFPLFDGFDKQYRIRKAEEEAAAAKADVDSLEQQVILELWTSYHGVKTAAQRVTASGALLASAEESEHVALGRYTAGVGSILDLLSAQATLASARAQEIRARADWFVSLAQLAHDIGMLGPAAAPAPTASGAGVDRR